MELARVSLVCKALSDPNRLRIIQLLTHGEHCGCELLEQMRITQPTLSHHMKALEGQMEPLFPERGSVGGLSRLHRIDPGCR